MERIRKHYQETGNVYDRPRSGKTRKTTARDDSLRWQLAGLTQKPGPCQPPHSSRRSGRQWYLFRQELYVGFLLAIVSTSDCCPETSAKQETAKKPCCTPRHTAWRKVGQQKSGEKCIFQINRQLSSIPSAANIVDDPEGPVWTHGSNLEVERLWFYGYIQHRSAREICKVDGNIDSAKYQQILASQYIPKYKRGQIFQQDGAPCHTSGSTMKFLRGKKIKVLQGWPVQSPDMNIIEHIWGRMKEEARRTKPKNLKEELWDACKVAFHAIPNDFIQQALRLSAKPDGNCSAGQKNPYKILIYLTFSPWWNTRLIFNLLFY